MHRPAVERAIEATVLVRDLINTPASDMGPEELTDAVRAVGRRFAARCRVIADNELLRENYPAIHAVGRASARPPRLAELVWGDAGAPKVTLVGKGVCFDTGGLDLKPSAAMRLMKKDMGGAALVLGLAQMIMAADLPVRLRLLVPAVENSVSGAAMRPLDVIRTRKGLTVEIGNTDAEGRLILADALAEAAAEDPALLIDCATLTGAARAALGTEVPALFTDDDGLAAAAARRGGHGRRSALAAAVVASPTAATWTARSPISPTPPTARTPGPSSPRCSLPSSPRRCTPGPTSTRWRGTRNPGPAGRKAARRWGCAPSLL